MESSSFLNDSDFLIPIEKRSPQMYQMGTTNYFRKSFIGTEFCRKQSNTWSCSKVVITSSINAKGSQFDPGQDLSNSLLKEI